MAAEGPSTGPSSAGLEDDGTSLEEPLDMYHPVPGGAIRLLKFFSDHYKFPLPAIVPGEILSLQTEPRIWWKSPCNPKILFNKLPHPHADPGTAAHTFL